MWDFQFPSNAVRNDWFTVSNSAALSCCSSLLLYQFWFFWAGFDFVTWNPNILILAGSLWKINQWTIVNVSLLSPGIQQWLISCISCYEISVYWVKIGKATCDLNVSLSCAWSLNRKCNCSIFNLHNKILNFVYGNCLLHSHSVFSLNSSMLRDSPFSQEYKK